MAFLIVVVSCIVGLAIGGTVGNDGTAALGFFGGMAIGLVLVRLRTLNAHVATLHNKLEELARAQRAPPAAAGSARPAPASAAQTRLPAMQASAIAAEGVTANVQADDAAGALEPATFAPPPIPPPPIPPPPRRPSPRATAAQGLAAADPVTRLLGWVKRWFSEGNVPVKVGMLVLFAGVGSLLKYASDQGWLRLPVEFRLAGIAIAAIAALAFGWRERLHKRSFALSLQGGAIGVLLMTVFAAFRLYTLLPAGAAFALMLVLVAGAGVLAVLQDALALAVLGIVAGFAAPILISTGSGNHVVLFAYYALLNLAIFAIAWVKPWRALNLLGFFFTYAIATTWGVLKYEHALFASTEPFLLIYFALYLAIPILYARQREPQRRDLVDGTLVFGNPLVAFALQAALLEGERLPLAYSALAAAAVYAVLGWPLLSRARLRVLGEAFAVLAVGFATLAVPLALSARSTACTFALEGAALIWLGLRQQQWLPRLGGLVLQALAAGAFLIALSDNSVSTDSVAIANGGFISAVLIAAAAFVSAWLFLRVSAPTPLMLPLYLWGLVWWLGAGLREIDRFVAADRRAPAVLGLIALSAALAAVAQLRLRRSALAWTAALAVAVASLLILVFAINDVRPLSPIAAGALAFYALGGFFALHVLREETDPAPRVAHLGWLWTWTLALMLALRQTAGDANLTVAWIDALTLLPLLLAWALALLRPQWIAPPMATRFAAYRGLLLASQALLAMLAFVSLLFHSGTSAPLPFLPLLNPVELAQIGVLACFARWLVDCDAGSDLAKQRPVLLAVAGFAFVTAATLRAAHQLGGAPWNESMWDSNLAQTSLTVVWSLLGVLGWVIGSRRGQRMLWLAGAALMGVVLAKLLLVDRAHLGNLFGIASFIAYGLLCTVIGYLAPAPPRMSTQGEPA
ncbi:MAG: DUF2339 domain-containing protein [Dokdonella sp.]